MPLALNPFNHHHTTMNFNEPTYTVPQSLITEIVAKLDMQPCGVTRHLVNSIEQLCQIQNEEKAREQFEAAVKAASEKVPA